MIVSYQTGMEFLQDNQAYLQTNPYLSTFFTLDAPLLKQADKINTHRLRRILGSQAKLWELDANLLRQSIRRITYDSKTVKVLLKNNQVLEECDDT